MLEIALQRLDIDGLANWSGHIQISRRKEAVEGNIEENLCSRDEELNVMERKKILSFDQLTGVGLLCSHAPNIRDEPQPCLMPRCGGREPCVLH